MYPVVIRSAVHVATRCALAITILLPEFKLENIACEEGKKRGSLHDRTPNKGRQLDSSLVCFRSQALELTGFGVDNAV
jgi:hypothetical protein